VRRLVYEERVERWSRRRFCSREVSRADASPRHEVETVQLVRRFEEGCLPTVVGGAETDLEHCQQDERKKDRYHGEDECLPPREFGAQGFIRER